MHDTLSSLVERALTGNQRPLEFYLRDQSRLPGPRANLELANDVSYLLAASVAKYPENVRSLITFFANGDRKTVPSNTPSEFVMLCGIIAFAACAAVQPAWLDEAFNMLRHYACSSSWRIREAVAIAYRRLLSPHPQETIPQLLNLAEDGSYLQQRAAIATIAEPSLLYTADMVTIALQLQRIALERVREVPTADRKLEDFRILRQTLGYTLSVVAATAPDQGFALMRESATWNDADISWILRENLKKKRMAKFTEHTAEVSKLLA